MKKRTLGAIFLSTAFLAGCHLEDKNTQAQSCGGGIVTPVSMGNEQQAKASVLNYVFDKNASAFQKNESAFCVRDSSVSGHEADASNTLSRLMKKTNSRVESYTACQRNKDSSISFSDQRAIEFTITEVSKISDDEYLVRAAYYEGNLSSQTNQYIAKKNGKGWTVTLKDMGPVS
ncbi:hypothetical protein [Pantoea sp. AS142]|uniref:hypothetical protein n=1 Tax=Pantoea sp. AS142 TaxID=3081292 RepID=UPI00301AC6D3